MTIVLWYIIELDTFKTSLILRSPFETFLDPFYDFHLQTEKQKKIENNTVNKGIFIRSIDIDKLSQLFILPIFDEYFNWQIKIRVDVFQKG